MTAVQNGQYDATLQDLPAARFYRERFPGLELAGTAGSHGYYVIYTRNERPALARRPGRGTGPVDRLGRPAPAVREVWHLDRSPDANWKNLPARSKSSRAGRRSAVGPCSAGTARA